MFLDYLKVMSSGPYNDPVQGRVSKGQTHARLMIRETVDQVEELQASQ